MVLCGLVPNGTSTSRGCHRQQEKVDAVVVVVIDASDLAVGATVAPCVSRHMTPH